MEVENNTMIIKCCKCDKEFERADSEVRRSQKLNRKSYCSLECAAKVNSNLVSLSKKPAGRKRMQRIVLDCSQCGNNFERRASEVNRIDKNRKNMFCSIKCSNLYQTSKKRDIIYGRKEDEFSAFREFFTKSRRRATDKSKEFSITLESLKNQWDKQKGICPYTGWDMETCKRHGKRKSTPRRASLDRIDSSKGYIDGNIQFISLMAQYAKNIFTEEDLIDFCEAVHNKSK